MLGFWILLILVLAGNAVQLFYVGRLEEELDNLHELLNKKEGKQNDRKISNRR